MKKDVLTILGCSSSLAVSLLLGTSAHANQITAVEREYIFTAPDANMEMVSDSQPSDCGCSATDIFSDEEGDRAIAMYGCDCAGCRYLVREKVEEEELNI